MPSRFAKDQRAAVFGTATDEAKKSGDRRIAPLHLLAGVIAAGGAGGAALQDAGLTYGRLQEIWMRIDARDALGDLDADALAALGIDLDSVRQRADALFGEGALERAGRPGRARKPSGLTREGKDALREAVVEARRHKDSVVDSGHLLVGLLANPDPTMRALLDAAGVDPEALAADTRDRLDASRKAA